MKTGPCKPVTSRSGTALARYQRLESVGLWAAAPGDARREVIVRLGEATLILADPHTERALSHWSLPAVQCLTADGRPAVFAPGPQARETVEIADDTMILALQKVARAVRARGRGRRSWRRWLVVAGAGALTIAAIALLPGEIISRAADAMSTARRAQIGQSALEVTMRTAGPYCSDPRGLGVLATLATRLFGPEDTPILYVLPKGLARPAHLPGGLILLPRTLIDIDDPQLFAGVVLAEDLAGRQHDPMLMLLEHAGVMASLRLLSSGELPDAALDDYGGVVLDQPPAEVPPALITAAFARAGVPVAPYVAWLRGMGDARADLLPQEPLPLAPARPVVLTDDEWTALRAICDAS